MDGPLKAAIAACGGARPFFRKLGLGRPDWSTTPRGRVFDVARISGMAPEALRPDLADWIAEERLRRTLAETAGGASLDALVASLEDRWDGPTLDVGLTDLWASMAAVIFVARVRGLKAQTVCYGKGKAAEEARTYAMALAHVVGRATSTHVANTFGCTRQNVDNASERYIRARDGDDPDDHIQGQFAPGKPRVMELGSNRLRLAKTADPALWGDQQKFEAFLRGEDLSPPKPERKAPQVPDRRGASKSKKLSGWAFQK